MGESGYEPDRFFAVNALPFVTKKEKMSKKVQEGKKKEGNHLPFHPSKELHPGTFVS